MKKTKKIIGEIERENLGLKSSHQHPLHPVCNNQLCVFNPQICLFYLFVCFHLFLLVGGYLLYNIVVVFAIHWHESAMDLHVFPIPIPPLASLPIPSLWVFPVHQAWALVSCIQPGLVICFTFDWLIFSPMSSPPSYLSLIHQHVSTASLEELPNWSSPSQSYLPVVYLHISIHSDLFKLQIRSCHLLAYHLSRVPHCT